MLVLEEWGRMPQDMYYMWIVLDFPREGREKRQPPFSSMNPCFDFRKSAEEKHTIRCCREAFRDGKQILGVGRNRVVWRTASSLYTLDGLEHMCCSPEEFWIGTSLGSWISANTILERYERGERSRTFITSWVGSRILEGQRNGTSHM
jgi:hypothetical protein